MMRGWLVTALALAVLPALAGAQTTGANLTFAIETTERFWVVCDFNETLNSVGSVTSTLIKGAGASPEGLELTSQSTITSTHCRCANCCAGVFVDPSSCTTHACASGNSYQIRIGVNTAEGGIKNCNLRADVLDVSYHPPR